MLTLEQVANDVFTGRMDAKTGRSVGMLCGRVLDGLSVGYQERLEAVDARLAEYDRQSASDFEAVALEPRRAALPPPCPEPTPDYEPSADLGDDHDPPGVLVDWGGW
jgi:hypothetical protein